jgi:flagellar biosynthesis/type III secretory pathway M-ring protein FliF/YscJ
MRSELSSKVQRIHKATLGEILDKSATTLRADFRIAPLNILALVAIFVIGLVVHLSLYSFSPKAVLLFIGSALSLAVIFRLTQV